MGCRGQPRAARWPAPQRRSNPSVSTTSSQASYRLRRLFYASHQKSSRAHSAAPPFRIEAQRQRVRFGEEEQRSERETTFGAKYKKVVASDMQLATTWRRRRDSNPRDPYEAYTISNRARSTKLRDFSTFCSSRSQYSLAVSSSIIIIYDLCKVKHIIIATLIFVFCPISWYNQ